MKDGEGHNSDTAARHHADNAMWSVLSLVGRLTHSGRLGFLPTGPAQAGFSEAGPSLEVTGEFHATKTDQFADELSLAVTRVADGEKRVLESLRFSRLYIVPDTEGTVSEAMPEPARALTARMGAPTAYSILFRDAATRGRIRCVGDEVARLARKEFEKLGGEELELALARTPQSNTIQREIDKLAAISFKTFAKGPYFRTAVDEMRDLCFWDAGEYRVEMRATVGLHGRMFRWRWRIDITGEASRLVKANAHELVSRACGGQEAALNVVGAEWRR